MTSEVVPSQRRGAARGRGCRRCHAALVCGRLAYPYAQVSRERNKSRGSLSLASQTFRWRQKTTRVATHCAGAEGHWPRGVRVHAQAEGVEGRPGWLKGGRGRSGPAGSPPSRGAWGAGALPAELVAPVLLGHILAGSPHLRVSLPGPLLVAGRALQLPQPYSCPLSPLLQPSVCFAAPSPRGRGGEVRGEARAEYSLWPGCERCPGPGLVSRV